MLPGQVDNQNVIMQYVFRTIIDNLPQQGPVGAPGSAGPSGNKGPIVSYPSLFSLHLSLRFRCSLSFLVSDLHLALILGE